MYARRLQLINYGPIDRLDIVCPFDDDRPKPILLVGENGSGKSILLSHIVNGLLLAQQVAYPATPEVESGKVYKLRSPSYITSGRDFYFAQVDFEEDVHVSELQLTKRRRDYGDVPSGILDTGAHDLWNGMSPVANSALSLRFDDGRVQALFERNCILYLPPNRFEDPAWLNEDNLKAKARHMDLKHLQGHTERTIINYSPLRNNENWLFDVVYDFNVFELQTHHIAVPVEGPGKSKLTIPLPVFAGFSGRAKAVYDIALRVVQAIIPGSNIRFGIGTRGHRVVSVMESEQNRVPNIFQLSSGEVSLLNLFLSILRDFDLCQTPFSKPEQVRGIVVVDEVDLHLHAVHQYEILPKLVQMFPRVQFVLTTHSPLFVLGLRNALGDTGFGLYRLPEGLEIVPEEFNEFGDAYQVFKMTNTYLAEIEEVAKQTEKPLVFVDGTTDIKYLARASAVLDWQDTLNDVEIRDGGGDGNLKNAWKTLTRVAVLRQTVVILHDCESKVSRCDSGTVFRRRIPLVEDHPIRGGIENLFSRVTLEKAIAYKPAFIDVVAEHEVTVRGQQTTIPEQWKVNEDEKNNLCDWLCGNGTADDFRYFTRILDELRQIPGIIRTAAADGG